MANFNFGISRNDFIEDIADLHYANLSCLSF